MSIRLGSEPETGRIVLLFVLPADEHPDPVSVVGSFNDWTPRTDLLIDQGDGTIGVNVSVQAGSVIHCRYLASNGRWCHDPDAEHVDAESAAFHVPKHAPADSDKTIAAIADPGKRQRAGRLAQAAARAPKSRRGQDHPSCPGLGRRTVISARTRIASG